jgi:toxin CcdB
MPDQAGFWLDCQTDCMSHYDTRLVIPLVPLPQAPTPAARLNPIFEINGTPHSLLTQYAGAIPVRELNDRAGSLADADYTIKNAIDFLVTGV